MAADSTETLQTLARAQLSLTTSIALVLEASGANPALAVVEKASVPDPLPVASARPPKPRPATSGPKAKQLDARVLKLLESRPGTSVAELERELGDAGVSRSRLEWSLRRLLGQGRISKSGNTCGARYSPAGSRPTAPSSSLRVVGS